MLRNLLDATTGIQGAPTTIPLRAEGGTPRLLRPVEQ